MTFFQLFESLERPVREEVVTRLVPQSALLLNPCLVKSSVPTATLPRVPWLA